MFLQLALTPSGSAGDIDVDDVSSAEASEATFDRYRAAQVAEAKNNVELRKRLVGMAEEARRRGVI